ncbi:MAG TPA: right-handed parallel beta-helix repeat-containing protein [Anaerolineaceae bacterium]|nr:right-handed parallel beta-helix repeat-containing protein [Anaerolineaceae bacterium]
MKYKIWSTNSSTIVNLFRLLIVIVVVTAAIGSFKSVVSAAGITYYVSPTGLDSNPGTLSQPFKTVQKGVNSLAAGNTLYLRGGTYHEAIIESGSGSSSAPIVISSYPGETAIIDGTGFSPSHNGPWQNVEIQGSYVTFENIEVTNSDTRGVTIDNTANYVILNNLNVNNIWFGGIETYGANCIIENSSVWQTNRSNSATPGSSGWSGALNFGDTGHASWGINAIIRNNQVYQNWGEGILGMDTYNGLIEGNRVWDNWAIDIYLDTVNTTTIEDNLVYYTNNQSFWRNKNPSRPSDGIAINDENNLPGYVSSHDIKVYNNIIINAFDGFVYDNQNTPGAALINDYVGFNTFVNNNTSYGCYGMYFHGPTPGVSNSKTIIENNISYVVYSGANPGKSDNNTGLIFRNNNWSKAPNASVNGANDIISNPMLSNPTHAIDNDQIASPVDPSWYALTASSPSISHAYPESWITTDYDGDDRNSSNPDIGPLEYQSSSSATNTPVVPTATITNTPLPATATVTSTPLPATATVTSTPLPGTAIPTNTPLPATATMTSTPLPATAVATNTPLPTTATITSTPLPATAVATNTPLPPTATLANTPLPPTATKTNTPLPPTAVATNTPLPATATLANTPLPPTATKTNTPVASTPTVQPTNVKTATPLPSSPTPTKPPAPTSIPAQSLIQLNPVADDYVSSAFPTNNYGADTVLKVRYSPARLSYLRFNITGLSGKTIKSATLRLRTQTASSVPIYVRDVSNNTWTEKGLIYNNRPALGSTHIAGPQSFQAETWISIDVTSLVNGNGLISLAVTLQNSASLSFYSRESGSNAPQLIIVPAS